MDFTLVWAFEGACNGGPTLTFGSADFELGLELDGAEVRGILLYEGREWGRVVFDMLS